MLRVPTLTTRAGRPGRLKDDRRCGLVRRAQDSLATSGSVRQRSDRAIMAAGPAVEHVPARSPDEHVVSRATEEGVAARAAVEPVVTRPAVQAVSAAAAEQAVAPVTPD